MESDLLASFLSNLKDVNSSLLELSKITAHNQAAVRILIAVMVSSIGGGLAIIGGLVVWVLKQQ